VARHLDHGTIVLGEYQRWPEPRTHDLASAIRHAGVTCKVTDNLARAHWEKLVWNIPFNGLGVASSAGYEALAGPQASPITHHECGPCLTTDQLLDGSRWETIVRELMLEVIATANALGLGVEEPLAEKQIERTRTMGAYKASTLLDFELGRPLELQSLFLEPLRQAQQAGMATPRLAALCRVLTDLNQARVG
jgi:2-dehydropantoate 2-reductase